MASSPRARVPVFPTSALGTLAHVGPLTRTVQDAALMLGTIAQPDARDVYAWIDRAPDYRIGLEEGVAGLRVAFSPSLGRRIQVEADVADEVAAAVDAFAALGAHVELVDPDISADAIAAWQAIWWPGMAYQLARLPGDPAAVCDPGLLAAANRGRQMAAVELIGAGADPC